MTYARDQKLLCLGRNARGCRCKFRRQPRSSNFRSGFGIRIFGTYFGLAGFGSAGSAGFGSGRFSSARYALTIVSCVGSLSCLWMKPGLSGSQSVKRSVIRTASSRIILVSLKLTSGSRRIPSARSSATTSSVFRRSSCFDTYLNMEGSA